MALRLAWRALVPTLQSNRVEFVLGSCMSMSSTKQDNLDCKHSRVPPPPCLVAFGTTARQQQQTCEGPHRDSGSCTPCHAIIATVACRWRSASSRCAPRPGARVPPRVPRLETFYGPGRIPAAAVRVVITSSLVSHWGGLWGLARQVQQRLAFVKGALMGSR